MPDISDNLQRYLVGGAVRDRLLGLKVKDRDWVVIGSTPSQMETLGFRPVGKFFPVFLHPHSGEEYALARREKKVGKGYSGFETISDPDITLEQDLLRRDLTVNAIAEATDGTLIDPFNGQDDLKNGILRHVSEAFVEDPLRVLRVARFAARFHDFGFVVADETVGMMKRIVKSGEIDTLIAERIWQELHSTLTGKHSQRFVEVLRECDALKRVLPEVDALFGVPQSKTYHPEIDTGIHTLMALRAAHQLTEDPKIIFAVLVHDLGKAFTPKDVLPSHRGHEQAGIRPIEELCTRLRVPKQYRQFALQVCENHLLHHQFATLKPSTMLKLFERLDIFRQPQNLADFCTACAADLRGRLGLEGRHIEQTKLITEAGQVARQVDVATIAASVMADLSEDQAEHRGKLIADSINRERVAALRSMKQQWDIAAED